MPTDQIIEQPTETKSSLVTELAISGMTCGNCARHVTEAIQSVPGVRSADVSLDAQAASVRWAAGTEPDVAAVVEAVKQAGYGAEVAEPHSHDEHKETKLGGWQLNLWIGALGTLPLMAGEWLFGLGSARWFHWVSLVLASVVQAGAGARFYRGAWGQLKVGSSNMDTLVALGSSTAFGYSLWALLSGWTGHLYFMEAAAIITLISAGHWVESLVSVRASAALRKLLHLAPALARKQSADGVETEVPVTELVAGDRVVLRPGDRVPTDGEVIEGNSTVDESMLTGESNPVDKSAGSPLYAGTVNLNGRLLVRVTATGEQTALAHIIVAVQRAQNSRANIQRLGDRVSSVFVPVVVIIALLAGLWWGLAPESARQVHETLSRFLWPAHLPTGAAAGFIIAAAVLIIACPCAMGLATPAAIMAGSNAAAERGILVRDGVALEKAGTITSVIFDKTGTLTLGKPSLAAQWHAGDQTSQAKAILEMACALARHSTHPISLAIASLGTAELPIEHWEEMRGSGVQGAVSPGAGTVLDPNRTSSGRPIARLGSLSWLKDLHVDVSAGKAFIENWSGQGATVVGLSLDDRLVGLFAVKDTLKPGAAQVIAQLHRQGLTTYLVTGDNSLTAASVGKSVGIDRVFAEVRPEQKAEYVSKLQRQGERVAFVGDGINDAPALEQADLGIAVSRASDIAREAADIILLKSEIEAVPESLGIAHATLRTIKQNLFWAFFYNAIGVPLAALGFMSPVLCAAAMGLSDLVVIGNALRLRRWRLPKQH